MSDDDLDGLRKQLGLGPDEPCPSPDAFAYAQKITPKKGYFEIDEEDGMIGIYNKKTEIITVVPADFDPHAEVPCYNCGEPMQPMNMKCIYCGSALDPVYVWEQISEDNDEPVSDLESGRRLMWVDGTVDIDDVMASLREASIPFELREDDDDGLGNVGTAIWVANALFGAAQSAIARPGVEG